jgi:hypothetical protein
MFFPDDKQKLKMGKECVRKTVVMPVVELSFIKSIKDAADVTVNDVMLSATTGMIKRFCAEKGDSSLKDAFIGLQNRALVPVAFPRPPEELSNGTTALRNKWAFACMDMPTAGNTALERLRMCNECSKELKQTPIVMVQYLVQTYILPLLPRFLRQKTAYDIFTRHSMVFSNLPGAAQALSMGGESLVGVQVIFPNLLPQALIISYNGKMFFNLSVNKETISDLDVHLLGTYFIEELNELADEFNVRSDARAICNPNAQHLRLDNKKR